MKGSKRPIRDRLRMGFAIIISVSFIAVLLTLIQIRNISGTTKLIYEHPLQVSNAVRDVQISINAIHRSMKDIALTNHPDDIDSIAVVVDKYNASALDAFSVIFHQYLGPRSDIDSSFIAFMEWKPIRSEVISLKKEGHNQQAIEITKGKGADHVEHLFYLTGKMSDFAEQKAIDTYYRARQREKNSFIFISCIIVLVLVVSIITARKIARSIFLPINSISERIESLITLQSNKHALFSKHIAEEDILDLSVRELEDAYKQNRDNNKKLKNFNLELEKEVKNRTSELETSKEKLHLKNREYEAINEELKQTNEEMEATNEELSQTNILLSKALKRAEESDNLKSSFLANMSHEIRTPMNGILGFTELLKNKDISEQQHDKYVGIIHDSGNQLLGVVNNILDVSKIEAGSVELNNHSVHLNKVLDMVYSLFNGRAADKNVLLAMTPGLQPPEDIMWTDETKLTQILINLVNNALKFTREGSIEFGYITDEKFIEFFVKDTGVGISQEKQKIIFDRFAQAGEITDPEHAGTGLGLTICKGFIELMKGEIWVKSVPEKGSTFYFRIPFVASESDTQITIPVPKITSILSDAKILVAEDTDENFEFLNEVLSSDAGMVIRAHDGYEAINIVKQTNDIDLVLMDIKMPLLDGFEATKEIKKLRPGLPVIAQTAFAMVSDKAMALEVGCDDYISKPIEVAKLLEMINRHIPDTKKNHE